MGVIKRENNVSISGIQAIIAPIIIARYPKLFPRISSPKIAPINIYKTKFIGLFHRHARESLCLINSLFIVKGKNAKTRY